MKHKLIEIYKMFKFSNFFKTISLFLSSRIGMGYQSSKTRKSTNKINKHCDKTK